MPLSLVHVRKYVRMTSRECAPTSKIRSDFVVARRFPPPPPPLPRPPVVGDQGWFRIASMRVNSRTQARRPRHLLIAAYRSPTCIFVSGRWFARRDASRARDLIIGQLDSRQGQSRATLLAFITVTTLQQSAYKATAGLKNRYTCPFDFTRCLLYTVLLFLRGIKDYTGRIRITSSRFFQTWLFRIGAKSKRTRKGIRCLNRERRGGS